MMQRHPMKPVLCIRNDRDDTLGITATVLREHGVPILRLDAFDPRAIWPDLEEIGGLIVFGGEMNVDQVDRYPYLMTQRRLMRSAVDAGFPVLGICLGAQLLARALDARVDRAPVRELGFKPVRVSEAGRSDPLLGAFNSGDRVFQWHEDTFDLPTGAELLASGDDVPTQAFRFGERAWGVQFHFEVDRAGVDAWLRVAAPRLERVWQRSADDVRSELDTFLDAQQQRAQRVFAAFARTAARLADGRQ
jgi:GMP synthase (glutamine-hydrolysing)